MERIQRNGEIVEMELNFNGLCVTLTSGAIDFSQEPNPCPNDKPSLNFRYSFSPKAPRNDGHLSAVQIKVGNEEENSGGIVFFVIPQNDDTITIGIPDDKGGLYPLFVHRQFSMNEGENNWGWNNFSYPPAAIACFRSQKQCSNLKDFLLYISQNPIPNSVLLNFPPDSDMAIILSQCHGMYFSQN